MVLIFWIEIKEHGSSTRKYSRRRYDYTHFRQ